MRKNVIVFIVLGLLIVISAVQALELIGLKAKISDASFTVKGSSQSEPVASSSSSSAGNTVAASIADLPSMVGGC